jgi:hypothetical protein
LKLVPIYLDSLAWSNESRLKADSKVKLPFVSEIKMLNILKNRENEMSTEINEIIDDEATRLNHKIELLESHINNIKKSVKECFGRNPVGCDGWLNVQVHAYNMLVDMLSKDMGNVSYVSIAEITYSDVYKESCLVGRLDDYPVGTKFYIKQTNR